MVRAHVRPSEPPRGRRRLSRAWRATLARAALAACVVWSATALPAVAAPGQTGQPGESADPIEQLLRARTSELRKGDGGVSLPPLPSSPTSASGVPPATAAPAADVVTPAAPPPSVFDRMRDSASSLVVEAMGFIGVRYRRGGNSAETGFDCSGFVRHVYNATFGIVLPRQAVEQAQSKNVVKVEKNDLQPGDLVFFNTLRRSFSHVGIYVGDNRFIHSPRTGEEVRTEKMDTPYWQRRYNGARRVVGNAFAAVSQAPARLLDPGQPDSRP